MTRAKLHAVPDAPSRGTAREIAWRIRNRVPPKPVFAGETRKREGDTIISNIGIAASKFERFERNGEYCMLPWIRVLDQQRGKVIEAPLTQVELLEFQA